MLKISVLCNPLRFADNAIYHHNVLTRYPPDLCVRPLRNTKCQPEKCWHTILSIGSRCLELSVCYVCLCVYRCMHACGVCVFVCAYMHACLCVWYMCVHACVCVCEKISNLSLNVACIPSVHYCLLSNHQTTYLGSLKFASCTVAISALSQPCLRIFLVCFSRGFHAEEKWMVPNLLIRCRNSQHLFWGLSSKDPPTQSHHPQRVCNVYVL